LKLPWSSVQEPQWAELPAPALASILSNLFVKQLFTTVPFVCQNWRRAALSASSALSVNLRSAEQLEGLALWLQKHGHLLKELKFEGYEGDEIVRASAVDIIGSALTAAAARSIHLGAPHAPLRQLEVLHCNLPDSAALVRFVSPSSLTSLELRGPSTYNGACPLGTCICPAFIQQLNAKLPPYSIAHFTNLQSFSYFPVHSGRDVQQLSTLQHLTSLDLSWSEAAKEDPDAACWVGPNLGQLQKLDLDSCSDGDAVVQALPGSLSSSLTRLFMDRCNLSDAGVSALVNLTALKYLDLGDNEKITRLPAAVTNLRGLTEVSLAGASIEDDSLDLLAGLPQLKVLELRNCEYCSVEVLRELAQDLPQLEISHQYLEVDPFAYSDGGCQGSDGREGDGWWW
jgi:hypothetical protein